MINDQKVIDCGFKGSAFTWWNKREGIGAVKERLDRALCSVSWKQKFPNTVVLHEFILGSDHCPLIVNTHWNERRGPRHFS